MYLNFLFYRLNRLNIYLNQAQKWPWYNIFWVVVSAFVVASVFCIFIGYLLIPDISQPKDFLKNNMLTNNTLYQNNMSLKKESITEQDLQIIYYRNIFNNEGTLGDVVSNTQDESEEITKTDLPLKLLGIIYGGNPYIGIATIINNEKDKVNSFVVGDILMDNVELIEIHRDKVILKRNNKKEYLALEMDYLSGLQRKRTKRTTGGSSLSISTIGGKVSGISSISEEYREEGFERKKTDIVLSKSYKEKLLGSDFAQVLQDAKATPNVVDGKVKGFVLTRIRDGSIYQKAGLQDNDIVEEINGTPLNDVAGSVKLLQSLRNETNFEVLVRRGGSTFTLKINVQ